MRVTQLGENDTKMMESVVCDRYSPGLVRVAVEAGRIPLLYRIWCAQAPDFRAIAVHTEKKQEMTSSEISEEEVNIRWRIFREHE